MGVISFLFSYIGISIASLMFNLQFSPDAINVMSVGIFILITWYGLGIIINHRAMGPMGAVKRHFSIVANGDYYLKFKLRMGDDLKYISEVLNNMTGKLMSYESASIERLEKTKTQLEAISRKGEDSPSDISEDLQAFINKLKE